MAKTKVNTRGALKPKDIQDILNLRCRGLSYVKIGREYNVDKGTIKYHCNKPDNKAFIDANMDKEEKTRVEKHSNDAKQRINEKYNTPELKRSMQDKRTLLADLKKTILWKKFGNELTLFDAKELADFVEDHKAMIRKSINVDTKIVMTLASMLNNQLSFQIKENGGTLTFKQIGFVLSIVTKMQKALGEDLRTKAYTTKDRQLRRDADTDATTAEKEEVSVDTAKEIANVFNQIMDKVENASDV